MLHGNSPERVVTGDQAPAPLRVEVQGHLVVPVALQGCEGLVGVGVVVVVSHGVPGVGAW